jgi:hypothetical protein
MILQRRPRIALLGMMSKIPVAGVVWQTLHYLVGLRRLGYDVHYVEAHARTPGMLMEHDNDDASARASEFIGRVMRRFDLGDRWAFHALHDDGRCYGMSEGELKRLYRDAALLINLHGGTKPQPEHAASGRLVYVETDPVGLQVELHRGLKRTVEFLEPHMAFFTYGENYGNPDCGLPVSERFSFRPTRQPVVIDLWEPYGNGSSGRFTTIGNWQQHWRNVNFRGETYHWSKHHEFLKFIDLPSRTDQPLELALSSCDRRNRRMLEEKGWRVRDAHGVSDDIDRYRAYIGRSRAEFTVAKDQNVRMRSGWFSDRSATYLAAGRPVVTQETGFSNALPTGLGLYAFTTAEEIMQAIEAINANYPKNSRAAIEVAREYFSDEIVLTGLLADLGCTAPRARSAGSRATTQEGAARESITERIRSLVKDHLPPEAPVIVISNGSEELVTLDGHPASHFPQAESGAYAGILPVDSAVAIAHLESLRARGGKFLVIPITSFWWLDHYVEFREHLQREYRPILHAPDSCLVYLLERRDDPAPSRGTVRGDKKTGERNTDREELLGLPEQGMPRVITEISPLDREYRDHPKQYFLWGQRAVHCLRRAMLAGGRDEAGSILDLPSGHGRSLRAIRAAFPDARITAWDLARDAVDFCARVFGAIPVHGQPDPAANTLAERFDLIWCGSLFSHVDAHHWQGFLRLLSGRLSPRGLLVLTTRGRRIAGLMRTGRSRFGLTFGEVRVLLDVFGRDGFAHLEGGPGGAEGVSLASPAWVCSQLERFPNVRLVGFTEGGYGDDDVIACIGEPLKAEPAKSPIRVPREVP